MVFLKNDQKSKSLSESTNASRAAKNEARLNRAHFLAQRTPQNSKKNDSNPLPPIPDTDAIHAAQAQVVEQSEAEERDAEQHYYRAPNLMNADASAYADIHVPFHNPLVSYPYGYCYPLPPISALPTSFLLPPFQPLPEPENEAFPDWLQWHPLDLPRPQVHHQQEQQQQQQQQQQQFEMQIKTAEPEPEPQPGFEVDIDWSSFMSEMQPLSPGAESSIFLDEMKALSPGTAWSSVVSEAGLPGGVVIGGAQQSSNVVLEGSSPLYEEEDGFVDVFGDYYGVIGAERSLGRVGPREVKVSRFRELFRELYGSR